MRKLSFLTILFFQITQLFAQSGLTKNQENIKLVNSFLSSLSPDIKSKVLLPFEGTERLRWSNLPQQSYQRAGVKWNTLSNEQRRAIHTLLRSMLSTEGYLKAVGIIETDEIRGEIMKSEQNRDAHNYSQNNYFIAVFGEPSLTQPWGWKFEGHHLSLNFTFTKNGISCTPLFTGMNPAEVLDGPLAGRRVMAVEYQTAKDLLASMSEAQKKQTVINAKMPDDGNNGPDVTARTGNEPFLKTFEGISYKEMTATQKAMILQLINAWAGNVTPELAKQKLEKLHKTGLDNIHFSWYGDTGDKAFYYRIHAPGMIIEFSNRLSESNHIHSVWRDLDDDFGKDLIK